MIWNKETKAWESHRICGGRRDSSGMLGNGTEVNLGHVMNRKKGNYLK
jgi:hypothetical protein